MKWTNEDLKNISRFTLIEEITILQDKLKRRNTQIADLKNKIKMLKGFTRCTFESHCNSQEYIK